MDLGSLAEIMQKVCQEDIFIIQEEVQVQYDNRQQSPLGFEWRSRHYEILELLMVSKEKAGHVNFLVLTNGGVFNLVLLREGGSPIVCRSRWILKFRVGAKEKVLQKEKVPANDFPPDKGEITGFSLGTSSSILMPLELANVVYYHGHLCPELAVGYRAGLVARGELGISKRNAYNFFVIAESFSPAVDALQYLTGCTVGNENFYIYDLGKHVYYFARYDAGRSRQEALRLALTEPLTGLSHKRDVERKILAREAGRAEAASYQQAVDEAVEKILNLPEQALFKKTVVALNRPAPSLRQDYCKCSACGEVVTVCRAVLIKDNFICSVCATGGTGKHSD